MPSKSDQKGTTGKKQICLLNYSRALQHVAIMAFQPQSDPVQCNAMDIKIRSNLDAPESETTTVDKNVTNVCLWHCVPLSKYLNGLRE